MKLYLIKFFGGYYTENKGTKEEVIWHYNGWIKDKFIWWVWRDRVLLIWYTITIKYLKFKIYIKSIW